MPNMNSPTNAKPKKGEISDYAKAQPSAMLRRLDDLEYNLNRMEKSITELENKLKSKEKTSDRVSTTKTTGSGKEVSK